MGSQNHDRSPKHLFYKLLRISYLAPLLLSVGFGMEATAQNLTSTTATWASNLPSNVQTTPLFGQPCLAGDVYGNGTTDLVCVNQNYNTIPSAVSVLESTKGASSGFSTTTVNGTITSASGGARTPACALGDFAGDGREDLACFQLVAGSTENWPTENWPTVWFSTSTPFSLEVANQNLVMPIQEANDGPFGEQTAPLQNPFSTYCFVGHFMAGPGQQILCNQPAVVTRYNSNGTIASYGPGNKYYLWRFVATYSTSGAESVTETEYNWTGPNNPSGPDSPSSDCMTGDFNGGGLTGFACPDGNGGFDIYLSTGTGFAPASDWSAEAGQYVNVPGWGCTTGDFNGDGKTDIICYAGNTNGSGIFDVYLSTGSGFQPYQTWTFPMPAPQNPQNLSGFALDVFSSICSAADLNGDGKTDLLCYNNVSSAPGEWVYALSTGSGFTMGVLNSITPPSYFYAFPGNKDDDGLMTSAIPFYSSCSLGNFMGNGIPDILCNPDSTLQTTPLESYYIAGIISRQ